MGKMFVGIFVFCFEPQHKSPHTSFQTEEGISHTTLIKLSQKIGQILEIPEEELTVEKLMASPSKPTTSNELDVE
jgi:hypothetical protein